MLLPVTNGEDEEQCRAADAGYELVAAGVTADATVWYETGGKR